MTNRDELELQLKALIYFPKDACWDNTIKDLIDFIIQDRKRIVEPLVKWKNFCNAPQRWDSPMEYINETLKLAGLD